MNPRVLFLVLAVGLSSCSPAEKSALDQRAEREFINVLVYHARPSIVGNDLASISPMLDANRAAIIRWIPGAPEDYNVRVALAWIYCKWDLYKEAGTINGDGALRRVPEDSVASLSIYIVLMTVSAPEECQKILDAHGSQRIALFGRDTLSKLARNQAELGIQEIKNAYGNRVDSRLIFQSVAFLDKVIATKKSQVDATKGYEEMNRLTLRVFLSGNSWEMYIEKFRRHEATFDQNILYEDMMSIIGENAAYYNANGDRINRDYWLSKLRDVEAVLRQSHDNRVEWIKFLIAKSEDITRQSS